MTAKVLAALRVPGTDVHEVVQVHRRHLMELMQQWTRVKRDKADRDVGLVLRIDAELFRLDSVIQWLDAADRHLACAAVRPPPRPVPPTLPQPGARAGVFSGRANRERAIRAAQDRIRISDHDREHATAAALSAQTAGDLRRVMADLPKPL
jgi:hypothetical protein